LINKAVNVWNVDRSKVFATGVSNGGMMAARLYCEETNLIKGFFTVAASMPKDIFPSCAPQGKASFGYVIGTNDFVMYDGGTIPSSRKKGLSGEVINSYQALDLYFGNNGCDLGNETYKRMKDNDPKDGV
jgi:polyhydroxybutyrate depolymerase